MELDDILKRYNEPWRYHHTRKHLEEMKNILSQNGFDTSTGSPLSYAIVFHDAVYEPLSHHNEEDSNALWLEYAKEHGTEQEIASLVSRLILLTKTPKDCKNDVERAFIDADWNNMGKEAIDTRWLDDYEANIFKEYQRVSIKEYVKGRTNFIMDAHINGLITLDTHNELIALAKRKRRIGIYAGSFFPFHIGHLNILRKAEMMFDKVIVARGVNPEKTYDGDFDNVASTLAHHQVEYYYGQLVDYVNSKRSEFCEPVLIRGLRNGYDLNQETNLIRFVDEQAQSRGIEKIPIAYITCDKEYEHISSSSIRMLEKKDAERYLPKPQ